MVPGCIPEQLPVWGSWWEGAEMLEGFCMAMVTEQSHGNTCFSK